MEEDSEIGLKAGLEIHQQLNTTKLFCECPSILRKDPEEIKFRVERKLNPVVGETGEIDVAAEYEKSKDKTYVYEVYDTNCLVELDEEPPHQINKKALEITIQIALLLNCKILPVTQVMRKAVVDGSNTSGFQRTALIAHDGHINTSVGKVGIEAIMLEEDAARIISRDKEENKITFRLDRLGIPLVEIATAPDLHTPEQIKETALKIGEILRACDVKRGIGTIRQDLNISIRGSKRVEIKGFQDPKRMIDTVKNEISRQKECLKNKECKREVRRTNPDSSTSFLRPMPGASRMYPETDIELLNISHELINNAKRNLPKLTSEHRSYLKEFGLNEELVKLLLKQKKMEEFKTLSKISKNANLVAKMLTMFVPKEKPLDIYQLESILEALEKGIIKENDVKRVMQKIAHGKTLEEALKKEEVDLEEEIKNLIKEKPGLSEKAYMGLIMAKFKGKVNGKEVLDELNKHLGKSPSK